MSDKTYKPGDPCETGGCLGKLHTYCTKLPKGSTERVRYLRCPKCGWRPEKNKFSIPIEYAPLRTNLSTRTGSNNT